jgi:hypothetical protein
MTTKNTAPRRHSVKLSPPIHAALTDHLKALAGRGNKKPLTQRAWCDRAILHQLRRERASAAAAISL